MEEKTTSFLDYSWSVLYLGDGHEVMSMKDVLERLKADLVEAQSVYDGAKAEIRDLRLAIAAIEKERSVEPSAKPTAPKTRRRGDMSKGVLDALRSGLSSPSAIEEYLQRKGIQTSASSVSNALQRLDRKKLVRLEKETGRWRLILADDQSGSALPQSVN